MNGQELYTKEGKATGVFCCHICRIAHRTKQAADDCCEKRKCSGCEAELEKYRTICDSCQRKKMAAVEAERFKKATKIAFKDAPDGMVFSDCISENDGFVELDVLMDTIEEQNEEELGLTVRYVWKCKSRRIVEFTAEDVIEQFTQHSYDEWEHDGTGLEELEAAIKAFVEANDKPGNLLWEPDYTTAIIIEDAAEEVAP